MSPTSPGAMPAGPGPGPGPSGPLPVPFPAPVTPPPVTAPPTRPPTHPLIPRPTPYPVQPAAPGPLPSDPFALLAAACGYALLALGTSSRRDAAAGFLQLGSAAHVHGSVGGRGRLERAAGVIVEGAAHQGAVAVLEDFRVAAKAAQQAAAALDALAIPGAPAASCRSNSRVRGAPMGSRTLSAGPSSDGTGISSYEIDGCLYLGPGDVLQVQGGPGDRVVVRVTGGLRLERGSAIRLPGLPGSAVLFILENGGWAWAGGPWAQVSLPSAWSAAPRLPSFRRFTGTLSILRSPRKTVRGGPAPRCRAPSSPRTCTGSSGTGRSCGTPRSSGGACRRTSRTCTPRAPRARPPARPAACAGSSSAPGRDARRRAGRRTSSRTRSRDTTRPATSWRSWRRSTRAANSRSGSGATTTLTGRGATSGRTPGSSTATASAHTLRPFW